MNQREHLYVLSVSAGLVPTQQGFCVPCPTGHPNYTKRNTILQTFFSWFFVNCLLYDALNQKTGMVVYPGWGGRLKPVKSTFFWTVGCADLSIYSLKNQTSHSLNPLPKSPLSHPNFLVFIHNYVLVSHSKLIIFFLCISFYPT